MGGTYIKWKANNKGVRLLQSSPPRGDRLRQDALTQKCQLLAHSGIEPMADSDQTADTCQHDEAVHACRLRDDGFLGKADIEARPLKAISGY